MSLILWKSYADGLAITASSESGAHVAENVLSEDMSKVLRSAGVASDLTLDGDFGEAQDVDGFTVAAHNLTGDSTIRLELSNDAGFSPTAFDQTYIGKPPAWGWGEQPWGIGGWGGFDETGMMFQPQDLAVAFAAVVSARYWRVTVSDAGNAAGYHEIGRLMVGPVWRPGVGHSLGLQIGWTDPSRLAYMDDGSLAPSPRQPYRAGVLSWDHLTDADARGFNEITRTTGKQNTVFVMPYPDGRNAYERTRNFLARLIDWQDPRAQASGEWGGATVNIREATA